MIYAPVCIYFGVFAAYRKEEKGSPGVGEEILSICATCEPSLIRQQQETDLHSQESVTHH